MSHVAISYDQTDEKPGLAVEYRPSGFRSSRKMSEQDQIEHDRRMSELPEQDRIELEQFLAAMAKATAKHEKLEKSGADLDVIQRSLAEVNALLNSHVQHFVYREGEDSTPYAE